MLRGFDVMRYISDKQNIVIDIGSAYTKYGFAGEAAPRGIIRTEVKCSVTKEIRRIFDYKDDNDLYQLLVEFLHGIFFKRTVTTPKDIKIVVLESPLIPSKFRNILVKVLFRHFEVASLMILPTHLVTISTLGTDTTLVLDVGYNEATLIPVFEGVPILKAWQALPLAAQAVHERIKEGMKDVLTNKEKTENLIENIKVQTCFVTTMERSLKLQTENPPTPPPSVKYYCTRNFEIPGTVRENAFEVLWERDNDNLSIPTMILDALIKCPVDTRKQLAENVLLIGGTTMAKGFASRLKTELLYLVNSELYSEKLKIRTFKFHTAPSKPNYTAWLGGAIFGIADLPSRCISKENYLKWNRVPDWVSLIDNKKDASSTT
ncbi:actin-related protein 10 [Copidosoma floridanum]|uniref:actin-related protein 10 n=1 Tax=Copidosoma floridanum TaxID=29053 RepID=UPI0006C9B071|nr:actin-related protein 10 [Copidosoma floridanum]XP_023246269.1 actin-related protein 10 [Copidosoma floridanum]